jgi:tryptophan synthase alpha chain
MSRITQTFKSLQAARRKALIPFVTAGDPVAESTVLLMHALVKAGADIIELGVPFSDPMADGPVVQRSSERALAKGMSLAMVLEFVSEFRRLNSHTPVVLFGYANPIEAMGSQEFVMGAKAAGVDGVLVVDYPPEECKDFTDILRLAGVDPIFLLAPTSTDARIGHIAAQASGFVYYVSLKGVTGAGTLDLSDVAARIPEIRARTGLPVGVGFGIRDAATASAIAAIADAVVIGSRIIQEMEDAPKGKATEMAAAFLAGIREGLDAAAAAGAKV